MKKLFLLFLFFIPVIIKSQNIVDIKITQTSSSFVDVVLYPSYGEYSILSNVVFTLKWKNNQNISLGNPQLNGPLAVKKSGPVLTNNDWKYQIYSGFSFIPTLINQPIKISIPKSGNGNLIIAEENFVDNISVNGGYYVSIGGEDVTGKILNTKIVNSEQEETNQRKMFYSLDLKQFLFEVNGVFITTIGQKVNIFDRTTLILIKKF